MNTEIGAADTALADDVLRGISAIAAFIGVPERQAYYLAENNYIPVGKEGTIWIGSKSVLRAHYRRATQGTPEAAQLLTQPRVDRRRPARLRPGRKQARPEAAEATAS